MTRWTLLVSLMALGPAIAGCSMCCGLYDFEYPMFQSRYARMDPEYGRVGSVFSDPNLMDSSPAPTNEQVPRELEEEEIDPFEGEDPDTFNLDMQDNQTRLQDHGYRIQ